MEKDDNYINNIKKKKISIQEDQKLQQELKKWEVESTKGGKLNRSSTNKK
jgi:type III secretion system FlhB-like substrate exporter